MLRQAIAKDGAHGAPHDVRGKHDLRTARAVAVRGRQEPDDGSHDPVGQGPQGGTRCAAPQHGGLWSGGHPSPHLVEPTGTCSDAQMDDRGHPPARLLPWLPAKEAIKHRVRDLPRWLLAEQPSPLTGEHETAHRERRNGAR